MKTLSILSLLLAIVACQPSGSGSSTSAETSADFIRGGVPGSNKSAPVVKAGPDISIVDSDNNGLQLIQLQGSASDPQNDIVRYNVYKNGILASTGAQSTVFLSQHTLPVGEYVFKMEAIDGRSNIGFDSVIVSVKPFVNTAPVVNAGVDIARVDSDNNGSEIITLAGSATDAQNNISSYRVLRNGVQVATSLTASISVPVGQHTLVMEARDAGNLMGSDTMMINIAAAPVTPPPSTGGNSPVANAGPDISRDLVNFNERVDFLTINGSATAGSNPIVSYTWKVNNVVAIRGSSPTILTSQQFAFTKGNNLLELEVVDSAGMKSVDQAIVLVRPSLMEPDFAHHSNDWVNGISHSNTKMGLFSMSAGGYRIYIDKDGDGFESVRMTGAMVSNVPVGWYEWTSMGRVMAEGPDQSVLTSTFKFPMGSHRVELKAYKSSAKLFSEVVAGDTMSITVTKPISESVAPIASNFDRNLYLEDGGAGAAHWKDQSAFRFQCKPSHLLFDDPIVFPNQPGKAHLHMFFGNTMANANSTYDSLRSSGNSTCDGGPLNRSAYWMPAVSNGDGKVVLPDYLTVYYKSHPGAGENKFPRGLRAIFGYDHKHGPDSPSQTSINVKHWKCASGSEGVKRTIAEIQNCPLDSHIMGVVAMPTCWDGVNLDSPDHRSHMSYPIDHVGCPASHPVTLTAFTMLVAFKHLGYQDYSTWRLSSDHVMAHDSASTKLPGGTTLHSDWFGAWDDEVLQNWHDGCLNGFLSCSSGNTGNGPKRMLKRSFTSWETIPRLIDPPVKP